MPQVASDLQRIQFQRFQRREDRLQLDFRTGPPRAGGTDRPRQVEFGILNRITSRDLRLDDRDGKPIHQVGSIRRLGGSWRSA